MFTSDDYSETTQCTGINTQEGFGAHNQNGLIHSTPSLHLLKIFRHIYLNSFESKGGHSSCIQCGQGS